MFPYFSQPVMHLGPIAIHAFGALVAMGILIGNQITLGRTKREGLKINVVNDVVWYALVFGFVIAHVFDVVTYYPERVIENPLVLLKIWDGISSFGGMMGGLAGIVFYFKVKAKNVSPVDRWRYVDTIAYGWPFAWVFGRLGCTVANDHPGTIVDNFFLSTSLATENARDFIHAVYENAGQADKLPGDDVLAGMGFHNLGLYEMLYTLVIIVPMFLFLGRKKRPPGFFLATFVLLYVPIRFALDYLRMADATYGGFTPAQYASMIGAVGAGYVLMRMRSFTVKDRAEAV